MKRELAENQRSQQKNHDELPKEPFSETDMLLMWNKFAQRLSDSGQKIMATYMQINDPVLASDGVTIQFERLKAINPAIELLRKTFDLDIG